MPRLLALALLPLLSACAAGPGMVSVPLVGTLPTGGAGGLASMAAMSGQSMDDLLVQCELMAQMAVDPAQTEAMRVSMAQQVDMMGCPG